MRLWLIPTSYTAASVAAATVVPRLEQAWAPGLIHGMSAASATAFLSATASGMLAMTAIVFSIAFVMVQFSAVAYSPRLVLWFASRPGLYHALGVFMATFAYAMAAMMWTDRSGSGSAPLISTLLVIALLIASMLAFVLLVQSLSGLQITEVLCLIGDRGRDVLAAPSSVYRAPSRLKDRCAGPPVADLGPPVRTLLHEGSPRSITELDVRTLVERAEAADLVFVLACGVGDTLVEESPILHVHARGGQATDFDERAVRAAVRLGRERTFDQDPKWALRLLVDIAIKALSPAINDPTTAVQALDQIDDLLRRMARLDLESVWVGGADGAPRLFIPLPSWNDMLALSFDEIRQFGATSVQVMRRLRAALVGLQDVATAPERRDAVDGYLDHLDQNIRKSVLDTQDRITARQIDLQGLGLTRSPKPPGPGTARPKARPSAREGPSGA
ncbi:hypothetical protein SLNSH_20300 [Alsobacter soli]|uniref:DUF2254 domain-containing protein n=1 Tax=Alsobacter soli TaxID=2109933 RepID=A0A2T1HNQ2_9HYPH|nr:DUF2254 domain-containing protein [Alsobacter soli]PSC03179.1 hypothetical protein SLNSH_20300 [Alsobacter soli]